MSDDQPESGPSTVVDTAAVKALAAVLDETGLGEIEYEQGGLRIRVARQAVAAVPAFAPAVAGSSPAAAASGVPGAPAEPAGDVIPAPMVGTFYSAPGPNADPYIKVGDVISAETVIGIVEAMKVHNHIKAGKAGTVAEILVGNMDPVEFGQALVRLQG